MNVIPVLNALVDHGASFVVVGTAAGQLGGEPVEPADLDIVVPATERAQALVVDALRAVGATVLGAAGRSTLDATRLPWCWQWTADTPWGRVDVVSRYLDGTTFVEHDALAALVDLGDGRRVRCHPTRVAA